MSVVKFSIQIIPPTASNIFLTEEHDYITLPLVISQFLYNLLITTFLSVYVAVSWFSVQAVLIT